MDFEECLNVVLVGDVNRILSIIARYDIPIEILIFLSKYEEYHKLIVANISTPQQILSKLSKSHKGGIAINVAQNTSTHPNTLRELSTHSSWIVRSAVAFNPSTDEDVVENLLLDDNRRVQKVATKIAAKKLDY